MSSTYSLSSRARTDLDEIWLYIARGNLAAADRMIERIVDDLSRLQPQHWIGEACDEVRAGMRPFSVRDYVVYYVIRENRAVIVRILHAARDIESQF